MTEEEYRLKSSFREPLINAIKAQAEGDYESALNFLMRTHPNERPEECVKLLKHLQDADKNAVNTAILIMAADFLSYS